MKKSSERPDPDRGFGKFYISHDMVVKSGACNHWCRKFEGEESRVVLTKERVLSILDKEAIWMNGGRIKHYIPPPVNWIALRLLARRRITRDQHLELADTINKPLSAKFKRFSRNYTLEKVRILLNWMYDNNVNGVRDEQA